MEIQIFALQMDRETEEEERGKLLSIMPLHRRQRLQRVGERRQLQALWAYGLLLFAMSREQGCQRLPEIAMTPGGKPVFSELPEVHFNLSHTDGAVLCALHDHPLGVDIERQRPAAGSLMRSCQLSREEDFWMLWVHREATAKCKGRGIASLVHWNTAMEEHVDCRPLDLFPGFYAAVATEEWGTPFTVRRVTMDEVTEVIG